MLGQTITELNGKPITGETHDAMMRKTHLPVLMFGELAALIVEQAGEEGHDARSWLASNTRIDCSK